jgi:hypothetical protein
VTQDASSRRLFFASRRKYLEDSLKKNGALSRQDWSSLDYTKDPYLVEATAEVLHKRYQDLIGVSWVLEPNGKIAPLLDANYDLWMAKTVHVQDELFARGLRPQKADDEIHIPHPSFPEIPKGLSILKGKPLPTKPHLIKLGKRDHMTKMFKQGLLKISSASSWRDTSSVTAIKDDELSLLASYSSTDVLKTRLGRSFASNMSIEDGKEITIKRSLPDFYAYCLTHKYDHRLLSDFCADAMVIIHEPKIFVRKLLDAVKKTRSNLTTKISDIKYYDPYCVEDWDTNLYGLAKHFRYAYQNEFRICWSPKDRQETLESFFVEIGDMSSFAEMRSL